MRSFGLNKFLKQINSKNSDKNNYVFFLFSQKYYLNNCVYVRKINAISLNFNAIQISWLFYEILGKVM